MKRKQREENGDVAHEKAEVRYAGFWIRLCAIVLDFAVVWVLRLPLALVFWAVNPEFRWWGGLKTGANAYGLNALQFCLAATVFLAYFIILTWRYQATLGKMLFRLKVVNLQLQSAPVSKIIIRESIGKIASLLVFYIGFVWAAFDKRKQAWHDKIAETCVVRPAKKLIEDAEWDDKLDKMLEAPR